MWNFLKKLSCFLIKFQHLFALVFPLCNVIFFPVILEFLSIQLKKYIYFSTLTMGYLDMYFLAFILIIISSAFWIYRFTSLFFRYLSLPNSLFPFLLGLQILTVQTFQIFFHRFLRLGQFLNVSALFPVALFLLLYPQSH